MKDILKKLDVEEGEIDTFLALLASAKGLSAAQLAKVRKIPRPTVYGHLESLVEKGLVKRGIHDRGAVFYAETKESIADLFDRKVKSLERARTHVFERFDAFVSSPQTMHEPKFIVHEGDKAAEEIFWDILRSGQESVAMWPINIMSKSVSPDVFHVWTRERIKRGMPIRVIWPELPHKTFMETSPYHMKDTPNPLREVRILPKPIKQEAAYFVYGTKVAFLSAMRENFGFVIDSEELSTTLKNEFELLWTLSSPYSFETNSVAGGVVSKKTKRT